ncbi:hypothetical protein MRX96_050673 [Rhipicephalus microplus]
MDADGWCADGGGIAQGHSASSRRPPKENDAIGRPRAASCTTAPYFAPLNSRRRLEAKRVTSAQVDHRAVLLATLGGGQLSEIHNAANSERTGSPRFVVLLHGDACTLCISNALQ